MFAHLQPLASSPSGTFATRPGPFPTEEQFTTPRAAPTPAINISTLSSTSTTARLDRALRTHTRKISDSLKRELGFSHTPSHGDGAAAAAAAGRYGEIGSPVEMRSLVQHEPERGRARGIVVGKFNEESGSAVDSDDTDQDSGKGMRL